MFVGAYFGRVFIILIYASFLTSRKYHSAAFSVVFEKKLYTARYFSV